MIKDLIISTLVAIFCASNNTFYSSSVNKHAPVKSEKLIENVCVLGSFNNHLNFNSDKATTFSYDESENIYTLSLNLYAGDYFIPYIAKDDKYLEFPEDTSIIDDLNSNNISLKVYRETRCFKANIKGSYKLSIDGNLLNSTNWMNGRTSFIFQSGSFVRRDPLGTEKIYLRGYVDSALIKSNEQKNMLKFDNKKNGYYLKIFLNKGEYFRFYLPDRNIYINYSDSLEYAKSLFGGNHLEQHSSYYWLANESGYYEILLSSYLEQAEYLNDIWGENENSYIRYYSSNNESSFYILMNNNNLLTNDSVYIYTNGVKDNCFQYGINGSRVQVRNKINFCLNNSFFDAYCVFNFSSDLAKNFEVRRTYCGELLYSGPLVDGQCLILEQNKMLFEPSVSLLDEINSNCNNGNTNFNKSFDVDTISISNANRIIRQFNNFGADSKENVMKSSIYSYDKNKNIDGSEIIEQLENLIENNKDFPIIFVVFAFIFNFELALFFIFLITKNKDLTNNKPMKFDISI